MVLLDFRLQLTHAAHLLFQSSIDSPKFNFLSIIRFVKDMSAIKRFNCTLHSIMIYSQNTPLSWCVLKVADRGLKAITEQKHWWYIYLKSGNLPSQNKTQAESRKYTEEANPIQFKTITTV